jgi:hypothetical protein
MAGSTKKPNEASATMLTMMLACAPNCIGNTTQSINQLVPQKAELDLLQRVALYQSMLGMLLPSCEQATDMCLSLHLSDTSKSANQNK